MYIMDLLHNVSNNQHFSCFSMKLSVTFKSHETYRPVLSTLEAQKSAWYNKFDYLKLNNVTVQKAGPSSIGQISAFCFLPSVPWLYYIYIEPSSNKCFKVFFAAKLQSGFL